MIGAAAVSHSSTSGSAPGILFLILVLLPLLWVLARAVIEQPAKEGGRNLKRYRINTVNVFRAEFLVTLFFVAFALYYFFAKGWHAPALPVGEGGHGEGHGASSLIESILPLVVLSLPFVGAMLTAFIGRTHAAWRDTLATSSAFLTFALTLSMYPLVSAGHVVYKLPEIMGMGLALQMDFYGFIFAVFASFIWFLATFYSQEYMAHEHGHTRYYIFMLLSLGGTVGVFLAGELLSLFIFFEIMTLASYVLVIHAQSKEAMAAGRNYLFMGVFGGLCLLIAIMLLLYHTGTTAFGPNLEALVEMGNLRYLVGLLFFIGFGIKAGAVPMHIWLPQAHPVAPTPASALLSGIMIKTGAYGIIRVFNVLFTPEHGGHTPLWSITEEFGYYLIWVGVVTMFCAAVLALMQKHAKRVLAYSSVSQMGYILMGIGCAAYLGYEGAMGLGGLSYHIINHAFFKAGMFLMVGAIYLRTHDLDYSKLGGLWHRFPVTAVCFLVAGAAISGFPGFNGYISKTMLHHAIVEAFEHHHVATLMAAEKIFVLTGGLTFCYILRLFKSIFLGKPDESVQSYKGETALERILFAAVAAVILYGGLMSSHVISRVILPMGSGFIYDHHAWEHITHLGFFNSHDLMGIAVSLGIGLIVFVILSLVHFRVPLPSWLSVEHLIYKPFLNALVKLYMLVGYGIEFVTDHLLVGTTKAGSLTAC